MQEVGAGLGVPKCHRRSRHRQNGHPIGSSPHSVDFQYRLRRRPAVLASCSTLFPGLHHCFFWCKSHNVACTTWSTLLRWILPCVSCCTTLPIQSEEGP